MFPDNVVDFSAFASPPNLPPQNIEAEEAILGSILLDPEAITRVNERLTPEAFYINAHATIYRAMVQLHSGGKPTDLLSLDAWLTDRALLDKVGGRGKLAQLVDRTISSTNVDAFANLVIDKYIRRCLLKGASQIEKLAHDGTKAIEQVTDEAEQIVYSLAQASKPVDLNQCESVADVCPRLWQQIEQGKTLGLPTGFVDLDAMTGGFYPGTLTIAAARTAIGKALPLDAKIVTPSGWKLMRDIQVGDLVAGSDGKFYPVTGVFPQGVKQTYRVELNDGTVARCCADHLWFTKTHSDRKSGKPGSVKSLREIMQTLWVEHKVPRLNHQIPLPDPILFSKKDLPVHPYLLGVWLGDGCKGHCVEIANPEKDIQALIAQVIPTQDYISVIKNKDKTDKVFVNGGTTKLALRNLGLFGLYSYEKFIPEIYKTASVEQRFSLLAGLLDTDGCVAVTSSSSNLGNCVEYATTSERLGALQK